VVFCAVVFKQLVWCGVEGYASGLQDTGLLASILQTRRITLNSTPDQLLEKPQHEIPQAATTVQYSWAPDDGHSDAWNMLSKQ